MSNNGMNNNGMNNNEMNNNEMNNNEMNNKLSNPKLVICDLIKAYNNYIIENKPFKFCLNIFFDGESNILGDTEFNEFYKIEEYDTDLFEFIFEEFYIENDIKIFEYLDANVLKEIKLYGYEVPIFKKLNSFKDDDDLSLQLNSKIKLSYFNFYMEEQGYEFFYMPNIVFDYFFN